MTNCRYAIIIPVCNGARYLADTIASAMEQTRRADEIIVVDDASTDTSVDIVKSYGARLKYYFNEKSTGFVDAWNTAINKASCDFLTILHQDDLLHRDYLMHIEKAVSIYSNVRHFYAASNYIDEEGKTIKIAPEPHSFEPIYYSGRKYAQNYLDGVTINRHIHRCPGVTTSRDLLLNECSYRKEAGHIADDDFFLRVGAFTDVVGISQPLASYRAHSGSVTGKLNSLSLDLARDYIYQVRYYNSNKTILEDSDIAKLSGQAVKFINRLLIQSLQTERQALVDEAFRLCRELDKIIPSFMSQNLPAWAKVMWRLSDSGRLTWKAVTYAKSLGKLIALRGAIRSLMGVQQSIP